MSAAPVSVVVPVGGVDEHFSAQLDALCRQRTARDVELVFAANRAVPIVTDAVRAFRWPSTWSVRTVDASDVVGPSHARNVGWRAARHDVVLFCDADDVADDEWVEQMALAVERHGACGGRLEYELLNTPAAAARVSTSRDRLPVKFRYLPFSASCALGIRRDLLERIDGFDESMQCGEDVDLCWRVARLGVRMAFAGDAVMHYRLRAVPEHAFRQAYRYASDDAVLLRRHRAHGARWGLTDSVREWAATTKAVALAPLGAEHRMIAATRLGAALGRIRGALVHRVWSV